MRFNGRTGEQLLSCEKSNGSARFGRSILIAVIGSASRRSAALTRGRRRNIMLNRLTVSALLKAVIGMMAACVIAGLSVNAWDSWVRLNITSRMLAIADTSSNLFKAMHNLRTDRSTSSRLLISDQPMDSAIDKYVRDIRGTEVPAMSAALGQLPTIDFVDQKTLVPELDRLLKTLTAEHKEFWDAMSKPKASRRPELPKEYQETTGALLETLDKLSANLQAAANHQDPVIDQLLAIKQIAWLLRNTAGDGSVMISNGFAAGRVAPEARLTYAKFLGGAETAWTALELATSGMQLPPALSSAMAATKTAYFDPQYLALRQRLLSALIAGEKPEMTANQFSPFTVGRLGAAAKVAQAAPHAAMDHATAQNSAARLSVVAQAVVLAHAPAPDS